MVGILEEGGGGVGKVIVYPNNPHTLQIDIVSAYVTFQIHPYFTFSLTRVSLYKFIFWFNVIPGLNIIFLCFKLKANKRKIQGLKILPKR